MRKSITLSKRLIQRANDAELGILCGIVRLTKDYTAENSPRGAELLFPLHNRV
jgi:hypothetical protein